MLSGLCGICLAVFSASGKHQECGTKLLDKILTSPLPSSAAGRYPQDWSNVMALPRPSVLGAKGEHTSTAHSTATTLGNLPVLIILSILMLALSSSLAKRCTACMGSSQVSGSMYFLLVGILTAGKAKRADERGSAELPPTHPGKHYPSLSVSWSVGRTNVPPFYKQSKRLSSKVSKNFFFRIK